ncbi:RICIN domain-containing protein [Streptomyces sp. NPDC060334]|uniref:RICIN domain-containing protein n=1 Tax=Streptomyces sp. NPDC060334 TaxID=3347099 RepID=UPI00364E6899
MKESPLRSRPGLFRPRSRTTSATLASFVTSVAVLSVVVGVAVQPGALDQLAGQRMAKAGDDYDWYTDTAAEQLRQDQCLMADVLRLGGPSMATTAQDGLNQPQDKLHELANRQHWQDTPLAQAYKKDRDAASKELDALNAVRDTWKKPLDGLETPGGFTVTGFHWPPGTSDGKEDFYGQTGLTTWVADRFWKNDSDFYEDPTPKADAATVKALKDIGAPLYGANPSTQLPEWERQRAEHGAYEHLSDWSLEPTGADNARLFLASGGFARTAPQPGTAEHRIAVEDLKTRFASCAWRDPIDPNKVRGEVSTTAAAEWQQEIASQTTRRNQILAANKSATTSLATGSKALGDLLGHSWVSDRLVRWQDYWSAGGLGWIGDSPVAIQVPGAPGSCLDVQGGAKTNGTPVQVYTCNNGAAQQWTLEGGEDDLHIRNVGSSKCLDVAGNKSANGTKIQITDCYSTPGQSWKGDARASSPLKSVSTGKCLDLSAFTKSTDTRLWDCKDASAQKFLIKPSGHKGTDSLSYPDKAQFDKAKKGVTDTQAAAKKQLAALKVQLESAKKSATASDAAEQAAYGIADAAGAPRGRGLLVGQQKAQVTKGAVAALTAMVKAGETAEAATRAAVGDSDTIAQRALAQAAQVNAEFRKEAAHIAELQAKAAADAAKAHRDNAKKDKETAEAKLAVTLKAEADAKAAAADAHAKRLAAEAEEKTAKAEKDTAAAKQAEASQYKQTAQAEAANAQDAKGKAEAAEATAVARKNDAVTARDNAKAKRDDAWDAEQKADAARAKADAKDAYAHSLKAGEAADAARASANEADKHADDAEAAAGRARTAADAATQAAAQADAAATRAEAAAKRSRANADAAQAAKLKADAAVRTATSAAADAIKASEHASAEARTAVALAAEAEKLAKTAKTQADAAGKEAVKAVLASAKAAGYAHVTAQAAVDAGNAAAQVAKPANDAIQLGSPYVTTDSAASLVVLTGQASKTIAEQQKAVADAHAKNAQDEAAAAKNIADQATGDAKIAYQYAANAATHAANARTYAKEALGYAADAAAAAAKASASLARTVEYDQKATEDAAAADKAAGRAEGYAKQARESADQAALDASAARAAAAQAEQDAKDARAAADRAAVAATEAEQAAKDADKYAKEAQESADRAEKASKGKQIETGTVPDGAGGSIGNTFYVIDHTERIGKPKTLKQTAGCEGVIDALFYRGDCTMTVEIRYKAYLDVYLCAAKISNPSRFTCPASETLYLGLFPSEEMTQEATHTITMAEYQAGIDPVDILFGSWIQCFEKFASGFERGSWGGCAWAALDVGLLFAGKILGPIATAARAADAAVMTGIGFADAYKALRTLGVSETAISGITSRAFKKLREACEKAGRPAAKSAFRASAKSSQSANPGCTEWANDYGSKSHGIMGSIDSDGILNLIVLAEEDLTPTGSVMIAEVMEKIGGNAKGIRGTWLGGGDMKDNLDSFNAGIQSLMLSPEEAARLTFTGKMAAKYGFTGKVDIVKTVGTPGNYTKVEVVFWK